MVAAKGYRGPTVEDAVVGAQVGEDVVKVRVNISHVVRAGGGEGAVVQEQGT